MRFYRWCRLAGLTVALIWRDGVQAERRRTWIRAFRRLSSRTSRAKNSTPRKILGRCKSHSSRCGMVYVQAVNPRTGAKSSEMVWYLVYKIVNRPRSKPPLGGGLGSRQRPGSAAARALRSAGHTCDRGPRYSRGRRRLHRSGSIAGDHGPRAAAAQDFGSNGRTACRS